MLLLTALLRLKVPPRGAQLGQTSVGAVVAERRNDIIISGVFFFIALPASRALICIGPYQTVISFAVKTYCVLFPICYVCVYLCVHVCVGGQRFDIYGSSAS